jgi:AcrR family transcriptional regulator
VAAKANVNKTTIYRRWPTKADLVGAMLQLMREDEGEPPDTGSLRLDLLALLKGLVARASTPEGHGIYRVIMAEMDQPELMALVQTHREAHQAVWRAAIGRAIERGELPEESDPRLLMDLIHGAVMTKLFRLREPVDDDYLAAIVELVVLGAKAGGAIRQASH